MKNQSQFRGITHRILLFNRQIINFIWKVFLYVCVFFWIRSDFFWRINNERQELKTEQKASQNGTTLKKKMFTSIVSNRFFLSLSPSFCFHPSYCTCKFYINPGCNNQIISFSIYRIWCYLCRNWSGWIHWKYLQLNRYSQFESVQF